LAKARDYAIMRIRKRKGSFLFAPYSCIVAQALVAQASVAQASSLCGGHATREWLHSGEGLKNGKE